MILSVARTLAASSRDDHLGVVDALMLLQRLPVRVLVAADVTGLLDLQVDNLDMALEHDQVLERVAAGGAFVRPLAHVIDCGG